MKRNILFTLLLAAAAVFAAPAVAQTQGSPVRIEIKKASLPDVLKKIQKVSGFKILFTYDDIKQFTVDGPIYGQNVYDALNKVVKDKPLTYVVEGKYITILLKEGAEHQYQFHEKKTITVKGYVFDQENIALPGATIKTDNGQALIAGENGGFSLELPSGRKSTVTFSFIGMKTRVITFTGKPTTSDVYVTMQDEARVDEVVVNGKFTHRKESFTGASATYDHDELMSVGNQNLLKSVKILDPSFQVIENTDLGSNPNSTPTVQVRGATSFNLQGDYQGNPNQPLFILDGFEADITKMYDMDMTRIQSVTILKDAAAKAIYGSKAGNGVIVVETIRPKSGELKVYYNGNLNIEVPDLTGYNMMNAREKLDFEIERGMYTNYASSATSLQTLQDRLKTYEDNIARGVDTDWLAQPLRTGVGQKHSLTLEGGDSRMRYQVGLTYNQITGVMKGSDRRTLDASTALSYSYKNFIFRNTTEYTKNWAKNSPYGSFSEYVDLNPYWSPYDEDGKLVKMLGYGEGNTKVYNPLYNASLNTKDQSDYAEFRDNFGMEWHITERWRATGRFSYTHTESGSDLFYPASHTMFAEYDQNGMSDRKGRYTKGNGKSDNFSADAGINFNQTWGNHMLYANATWNMEVTKSQSDSYTAEGFGNDYMDDIGFATQYLKNGTPSSSNNEVHEIGLIGAVNYSYADRYLFDASIRETGSSVYGSDKRWGTFWSVGIGWNVHKEKFMAGNEWIKQLKLRASTGFTGTQNFNPYQSRARYTYSTTVYDNRYGALLEGLPNQNLQWQKVRDTNVGVDMMLKKIVSARFDYYVQNTSNMLSDITTVPSMGFTTYKENLGEIQNKGYDFQVSITPWRNTKQRGWLTFTVSALHNSNKIKKIYDIFKSVNENQNSDKTSNIINETTTSEPSQDEYDADKKKKTTPSTLYYEGCSMTAIWGVPSLGIDPETGKRIYVDKNGNPTYTWNVEDQVVIGDTNPKLQGAIGISGGWNGFTWSLACSYKTGGDIYNTTLVNKVENITGYSNLDKRIYDSWRNVGDIAPYRELSIQNSSQMNYTKPNSCFVQKNNELYFSTMNVGYEFNANTFIKRMGLERLKLSFYMNELARLSSIKIERGTDYPFARTYSLSVEATF